MGEKVCIGGEHLVKVPARIDFPFPFFFFPYVDLLFSRLSTFPSPRRMISRLKRVPVLVPVLMPVAWVGAEFSGGESFQFFYFFILFYFILFCFNIFLFSLRVVRLKRGKKPL